MLSLFQDSDFSLIIQKKIVNVDRQDGTPLKLYVLLCSVGFNADTLLRDCEMGNKL